MHVLFFWKRVRCLSLSSASSKTSNIGCWTNSHKMGPYDGYTWSYGAPINGRNGVTGVITIYKNDFGPCDQTKSNLFPKRF